MPNRLRIHGGNVYEMADSDQCVQDYIDFSASINPLGIPLRIKKAVEDNIGNLQHYPDPYCKKLVCALAETYGVAPDWTLCGNGAADLIFRLVYAKKPKKALLVAPSFSEYEEALLQWGSDIRYYEAGEDLKVHRDFLEMLTPDLDIVFLCNPNNPTGLCMEKDFLKEILQKVESFGALLALDECFLDFVKDGGVLTMVPELKCHKNLLIFKSFTKMFSIPGLRLGFVLCQDSLLLTRMSQSGAYWSVNMLAQEAGLAALKEKEFVKETVSIISRERAWLSDDFKKLGFVVYPGEANYLLVKTNGIFGKKSPQKTLYKVLYDAGILIRLCESYRGLTQEHFRVAVKSHGDNLRLIDALKRGMSWQG